MECKKMITFCLDNKSYKQKPQGYLIAEISNQIASQPVTMDVKQAAELIGNQGHTFCSAVFSEGNRKAEYFQEQQIFALDFDNGVSYDEIIDRCNQYHLEFAFSYHTFSSKLDHPKFRIVFVHVCPIKDKRAAEIIIKLLMTLFPEADKSCKDVSRMFFGGKGLLEMHPKSTFRLDSLAMEVEGMVRKNAEKNSGREISKLARQLGIGKLNGSLGIGIDFAPDCRGEELSPKDMIIISNGEDSSFYIVVSSDRHCIQTGAKKSGKHKEVRVEIKKILEQCRLFREFYNGERDEHEYKFCLMTNLRFIEGGITEFYKIINLYKDKESLQHWKDQYKYIHNNNYHPMQCEKICPYYEECNHKGSLVNTLKCKNHVIEKIGPEPEYDTLENVSLHIKRCLEDAIKSKRQGFYLIKAQTAVGKTYLYCQCICKERRPFIVAVPTNRLKNEVYNKLSKMNCELPVFEFPSLDDRNCPLPRELVQVIKDGYNRGISNGTKHLYEFIEKNEGSSDLEKNRQINYAIKYLTFKEKMDGNNHVVMTHARLLTLPQDILKKYQIIVDEDLLTTLFYNTQEIMIKDLEKARECGLGGEIVKKALKMEIGTYEKNSYPGGMGLLSEEVLDECRISGNINQFVNCSTYCRLNDEIICYYEAKGLPEGKYIVMSATLNRRLYEDYFSGRYVKEYPVKSAKYRGKLIQYSYYSTSRAGLRKHPEIFSAVQRICGKIPIITFKEYDRQEYNDYGLHIGNAIGINVLEGKTLAIVATPYNREEVYKLIALHLSYDISGEMKNRKVEANGYSFVMMTYSNQLLRNLQLYFMESDLEQTIGRTRLLRYDCTTYLFSSYPCEQAELRVEDYLNN